MYLGSQHGMTSMDRRRFPRLPLALELELHLPGQPVRMVCSEDLSHGGVMLVIPREERPALGSRVRVRVSGMLGGEDPAPLVEALVVRHAEDGIAVQFLDDLV